MTRYFAFLTSLSLILNGDLLDERIVNLVGAENYEKNSVIFSEFTNNKTKYITNNNLNYDLLLEDLQKNQLLNTKADEKGERTVQFIIEKSNKKGFKILKEALSSMEHYSYVTDFVKSSNNQLVWQIRMKGEMLIDPLEFNRELRKYTTKIVDIKKVEEYNWEYILDAYSGKLVDVVTLKLNEPVTMGIPLKPYLALFEQGNEIVIVSKKENSWVPKISFYDSELNVLGTIEMDRVYEGIKVSVPKKSYYVKIGDRYSLLNIKRGLIVTVSNSTKK